MLCSATRTHYGRKLEQFHIERKNCSHLFDNVRTKLLDRQRTDVPGKLTYNRIAEAIIVQIKDVLNDLLKGFSERGTSDDDNTLT